MMARLRITGAAAGSKKCCMAFSAPMISPLAPKITVLNNSQRMRSAVNICSARGKSGAMIHCTVCREKVAASPASTIKSRVIQFNTRLKSSHAPTWSLRARYPAKVGMNALPKAPPATSSKSRSGIRKAA